MDSSLAATTMTRDGIELADRGPSSRPNLVKYRHGGDSIFAVGSSPRLARRRRVLSDEKRDVDNFCGVDSRGVIVVRVFYSSMNEMTS